MPLIISPDNIVDIIAMLRTCLVALNTELTRAPEKITTNSNDLAFLVPVADTKLPLFINIINTIVANDQDFMSNFKRLLLQQDLVTIKAVNNLIHLLLPSAITNHLIQPQSQRKIFQIGFNKCATSSLHDFFINNKLSSIHYDQGRLAFSMYHNYLNGRPLLSATYAKYQAFLDMENIYLDPPLYVATVLYAELDRQYPGSKFILNTRDKQDWLVSRQAHIDQFTHKPYVEQLCEKYKITVAELVERWSQEWDIHHASVIEHFKHRPDDLLVFNIDHDPPTKLCDFLRDFTELDPVAFPHLNRTSDLSEKKGGKASPLCKISS